MHDVDFCGSNLERVYVRDKKLTFFENCQVINGHVCTV